MNKYSPALRRYCRQVRQWLPCGGKVAKRIIQDVRLNLEAYMEENPDANLTQLKERFGQPKDIACAYVDAQNTEELLAALRLRRRVMAIVAGVLLAMFAVWGTFVLCAIEDHKDYIASLGEKVVVEHTK